MIRVVTRARLAALEQDADGARERAREVQGAADRAYAGHLRTVYDLTADVEAAERAAEAAHADTVMLRELLECTEALLAKARATVAEQAARIDALSDLDAMAEAVVLLHYGQLRSIHPGGAAAKRHAASFGADPDGWGTALSDRPASEVAWRISPLSNWAVADGGDAG
ncbi:hypothetical protein [Streptomyces lydicus]|uniref:hypothetical protein n=1 Tax=Streptomyces lydicus TaxID=47763 RepID=UPI0036A7C496